MMAMITTVVVTHQTKAGSEQFRRGPAHFLSK